MTHAPIMPLDPEIAAILEAARAAGDPPLASLPVEIARQRAHDDAIRHFGPPEGVARVETLAIPGPAGTIPATLYRSSMGNAARHGLVFVHGGGWTIGSRGTADGLCRSLSNLADVDIISIDYRLAPEHPFPAGLEDCLAAVRWTLDHAADLALDPDAIGVGGDSAGANLASVVARKVRGSRPSLRCQFLLYPVTSAAVDTLSYARYADGFGLTASEMLWFWQQYIPDPADRLQADASPLLAADPSGLPRAVVVTAGYDILRDQGEAYASRLDAADVPTVHWRAAGMPHAFLNYRGVSRAVKDAFETCAQLLRGAMAGEGAPAVAALDEGEHRGRARRVRAPDRDGGGSH